MYKLAERGSPPGLGRYVNTSFIKVESAGLWQEITEKTGTWGPDCVHGLGYCTPWTRGALTTTRCPPPVRPSGRGARSQHHHVA